MTDALLTVDEMSAVLKIHPVSLRRFVAQGTVPVLRVGGALRFDRQTVLDHFAGRTADPVPQGGVRCLTSR